MLLLATSLVGLAAMANAQYIMGATETKMPPVGYTSGEINLSDGETGVFSWDASQYTGANYPVWGGLPPNTWQRAVAIHVKKGLTGTSAVDGLQVRYSTAGNTGDVWHVSPDRLNAADTDPTLNLWWCGLVSSGANGLGWDQSQKLELSVEADCSSAQDSCPLGAGFTATAWFYQMKGNWAGSVAYDNTVQGDGVVGGWSTQSCFGGDWDNAASAGWTNSGDMAIDAAFNPADTEGFSANWETLAFSSRYLGTGATLGNQRLVDIALGVGEVYPTVATWVERGSAGASEMLYATLRADFDALAHKFMLCVSSTQGAIWSTHGNAAYTGNFAACDLGCYPNMDCDTTTGLATGGFDMEGFDVSGYQAVYVTALITNTPGGTSDALFVVPGHSVAYAWGHLPSAATAFAPSLLLGVLALAAATQA